jgi:hypothetical protein
MITGMPALSLLHLIPHGRAMGMKQNFIRIIKPIQEGTIYWLPPFFISLLYFSPSFTGL